MNKLPDEAVERVKAEDHEEHPCGLCDNAGQCTFACETADTVPAPNPYRAALVLAERVLDDLSEPDPAIRRLDQMQAACARLRDEIHQALSGDPSQ